MDLFDNLLLGLSTALELNNLGFCFLGALIGTPVGVLPGIAPITDHRDPVAVHLLAAAGSSLIMLAGIFYGAQYGGSTTAILVNVPGEMSSVVTCLDGHQMAKQGRAGHGAGHRRDSVLLRRHHRDHRRSRPPARR